MSVDEGITRRDFLKLSVGSTAAIGLLFLGFPKSSAVRASPANPDTAEVPLIWLQMGACTGCSVSVLNTLSPRIQNLLLDEAVPGKHINLRYHPTIMAAEGSEAVQVLKDVALSRGSYILVVEGAIATRNNGVYCQTGEDDGRGIIGYEQTIDLGKDASAVLALGTCAAFGGIPAAAPNPTGCVGVQQLFQDNGIETPVINLSGCPPHPDWFTGTVASILFGGLSSVKVDALNRPLDYYGLRIHDNCPRQGYFNLGIFSKKFSDPYCMYQLGCKGPVTYADCPKRLWNSGTNWCIGANSICIGCANPGFPDASAPFMKKPADWELEALVTPQGKTAPGLPPAAVGVIGAVGGAALVGIGVAGANMLKNRIEAEKNEGEGDDLKRTSDDNNRD
jgi:hydrogenase small subunit